ncbi:MAG: hypothetical protein ACOYYS_24495 [Chloroflexota bacterium]
MRRVHERLHTGSKNQHANAALPGTIQPQRHAGTITNGSEAVRHTHGFGHASACPDGHADFKPNPYHAPASPGRVYS